MIQNCGFFESGLSFSDFTKSRFQQSEFLIVKIEGLQYFVKIQEERHEKSSHSENEGFKITGMAWKTGNFQNHQLIKCSNRSTKVILGQSPVKYIIEVCKIGVYDFVICKQLPVRKLQYLNLNVTQFFNFHLRSEKRSEA